MFPIDLQTKTYDQTMINQFDSMVADQSYPWKLEEVMPQVLVAGVDAGHLTKEGAALLDPSLMLEEGAIFAPPEGDAGTGMVEIGRAHV